MKVRVLLEILSEYNEDLEVVMSSDSEGNRYSPLFNACLGGYIANNDWSGEFALEELTPELVRAGYSEDDLPPVGANVQKVVYLWPTN